jgi:hypothetical protein
MTLHCSFLYFMLFHNTVSCITCIDLSAAVYSGYKNERIAQKCFLSFTATVPHSDSLVH